jgi:hypothetical protein
MAYTIQGQRGFRVAGCHYPLDRPPYVPGLSQRLTAPATSYAREGAAADRLAQDIETLEAELAPYERRPDVIESRALIARRPAELDA